MFDTNKPMETIKEWQKWYRSHRIVAEIDEPLATKDSRESLHDTSKTTDTLNVNNNCADNNWLVNYCKTASCEKAKEYFADTIAEFCSEISGKEMYDAFYAAALQNMEHHKKEYQKAKELIDLLSTRKMEE